MADLKKNTSAPKVKYVNNHVLNKDLLNKSYETSNILFGDSYVPENDLSGLFPLEKSTTIVNNNTIECVTVKLIPSPEKKSVTYLEFEKTDKSQRESDAHESPYIPETVNEMLKSELKDKNVKNCYSFTESKNESFNESNDIDNKKSIIKVKVILPKFNTNKEKELKNRVEITTQKETQKESLFSSQKTDSPKINSSKHSISQQISDIDKSFTFNNQPLESEFLAPNLNEIFEPEHNCQNLKILTSDLTDEINKDTCIFEENKNTPLSPIKAPEIKNVFPKLTEQPLDFHEKLIEPQPFAHFSPNTGEVIPRDEQPETEDIFPNVVKLVDFHEKQSELQRSQSFRRYSLPVMGKATLLAKVESLDEETLRDSEIIHELVRDRFIVNTYESRIFHRSLKKPSRYGKIYRSLERKMKTDTDDNPLSKTIRSDIIQMENNSAIKLSDRFVSLNSNEPEHENSFKNYSLFKELENKELDFNEMEKEKREPQIETTVKTSTIEDEPEATPIIQDPPEMTTILESKQDLKSADLIIKEIIEQNKNEKYSTFNSEYTSTTPFSENYSTLGDMSSCSAYETATDFKYYATKTAGSQESVLQASRPKINSAEFEERGLNEIQESTTGTEGSYDMEEFLKKALGDELINEVSCYITQVCSFITIKNYLFVGY